MPYGRKPASLQRCTTRSAIDLTWRSEVPLATTIVSVMSVSPRTSSARTSTAFMSASASSTTSRSPGVVDFAGARALPAALRGPVAAVVLPGALPGVLRAAAPAVLPTGPALPGAPTRRTACFGRLATLRDAGADFAGD